MISTVKKVKVFALASLEITENCWYFVCFKDYDFLLNYCIKKLPKTATLMQSDWKNVNFQHRYGHFRASLHHASDHLAIFLTVFAGRTVKISTSPRGPGFESRRPHQKGHRSIAPPVTPPLPPLKGCTPLNLLRRPCKSSIMKHNLWIRLVFKII